MLFEVDALCKRFGQIVALSDVSFQVRAGEVLGLIGPNGAGKSTLFECLGGVLPSDSGTVRAGGRPVGTRERPSLLFYVPDGIVPRNSGAGRLQQSSFDGQKLLRPAYVTVIYKGVMVHHHKELMGPMIYRQVAHYAQHGAEEALMLQDHNGDLVRYRNIWIRRPASYDQPELQK
jgi:ABC-type branched-subunit amino acid transport system ATPase component